MSGVLELARGIKARVEDPQPGDRPAEVFAEFCKTAYNGGPGSPAISIMGDSYNAYYWSWIRRFCTYEEWQEADALSREYRDALRELDDARGWEQVDTLYFADNSVEAVERAADGEERRRMLKAPSGDAC